MRIISGINRGRKLAAPLGNSTRPTADRVKEALFSMLSSRIDFTDLRVLDICAGTGSLGLEALSRGAGLCCFIEHNPPVATILQKNVQLTGSIDRSEILTMEAVKALRVLAGRGKCYDLAFFDPPYSSGLYQSVLAALETSALLVPGAIVVAECSMRSPLEGAYGRLQRFERRLFGATALELFILE